MSIKNGKYIEFTISDGDVTVEPHGFTGKACRDGTFSFEQALGAITSRRDKPEAQQRQALKERA